MTPRLPLLVLLALAAPARASLSPAELANAGVNPPPGATLPIGLRFVDQNNRAATLSSAAVPTVLLFIDYSCQHLCGPGLTLTAGALHDAKLETPRDYRLVAIGMDGDGPARARAFAASHLAGMPDILAHAEFLTGNPATVAAAEKALGYHAVYDASVDQFAHDAASFVFTPGGALSHVLPETAVTPAMVAGAVRSAAQGVRAVPQPSVLQQVATLCYGFAAAHGIYGGAIVTILRLAGVATLAAIAFAILRLSRRRRPA